MAAVEQPGQVDRHHVVPRVGRHHVEIALRRVGPRAVDQNVDAAVLREDGPGGSLDRLLVRDVEQDGLGAAEVMDRIATTVEVPR